MLVAEGPWLEQKDCFARFVHRLDLVLETLRGDYRAELAGGGIYHYCGPCNDCPIDAGDKSGRMGLHREVILIGHSLREADADGVRLGSNTEVADVDVVVACGEILTGVLAQCDVGVACCTVNERSITIGCVRRRLCYANMLCNALHSLA